MWILSWLPEFLIHIIFLAGIAGTIAGFVLGFIPFVSKYKLPIQIISLLLLSLGVYLEGGLSEKKGWELKVKEMEAKVAEAQAKSAKVNTVIVEKVLTQKQIIKVKGDKVIEYIKGEAASMNEQCTVPEAAIKAHNLAASDADLTDNVSGTDTLSEALK